MQTIKTIDAHTAGEPLRIITDGYPTLTGDTILAKRNYALENYDHLRRLVMLEPRGHADMYGCIVVEPERPESDLGVLFLHNEGYSTMCGHGIIALVMVGLEQGLLEIDNKHRVIGIDTPAGQVKALANWNGHRIESVSFDNVASFVLHDRVTVNSRPYGKIETTVAFGGAFYAYVDAMQLELSLDENSFDQIVQAGKSIKQSVIEQIEIKHPDRPDDLNFLYGVIFVGPPANPNNHSRNVCVFADGEVDRSPTGTGVSGRAAIHAQRGELEIGQRISIESILGTTFDVIAKNKCAVGDISGIVPTVTGKAYLTGRHEFVLDERDDLANGFLLR